MLILIVEDEPLIRLELESIVTGAGHVVVGSTDCGPEAIRLAEERAPDLVLMDIGLAGDMNGIEAATTINERWGIRSLFVSAISAQHRDSIDAARPFGIMLKPVVAERLARALEEVARRLRKSG